MTDLTAQKRADLGEALAKAMEPEAWARVETSVNDRSYDTEDGVKVVRSIRHATAVMMLLEREGLI